MTNGAGYEARAAALAAGIPISTPVQVINRYAAPLYLLKWVTNVMCRFCSSGLMAVTTIANQIRVGQIDVGLAVGIESMSCK